MTKFHFHRPVTVRAIANGEVFWCDLEELFSNQLVTPSDNVRYRLLNFSGWVDVFISMPTGVRDRNGVEIYEDDICLFDKEIGRSAKVVYENSAFYLQGYYMQPLADYVEDYPDLMVIGNIHQNPDLLK